MDVSKVRLRVKKADGDDIKPTPEPRMRDRRKVEVSEDADSSLGPINLSIKKSGKTNLDSEGAKKPAYETIKEKSLEKRAEKRAMLRSEGKETNSKKARIKETVPSIEKQDSKKDKDVKKIVAKSTEKVSKSRKKEQKAAKENKETLTKIHDSSEEGKKADLQKRQQNQRTEKEIKAKEQKQKEEEERRVRKRQEDERLERVKKEKEQKQREEEERREIKHQEKERIEQELREKRLKQKEQEKIIEKERVEKEKREKERKEEEQRERERLERELRAQELKEKEEETRREREMREKKLKEEEELRERERLEKENKLLKKYAQDREVDNVTGLKKASARKATKQKQTGNVNCDNPETSQNRKEAEPKITKRKAGSAPCPQEEKTKRRKVKAANIPCTSKVKKSKAKCRQSRKSNELLVGAEVLNTSMETDEAAKALELSSVPEKVQSSPVKKKHASEELSITKNLSDNVGSVKASSEGKDSMEAQTSSDIDSGTDSPTLDLSKPPCSKSQEGEDDEGIHSHDGGSDISDCVSEVSYDSGLNGKLPETPTEELPTPTQLLSHTCVFCDRTFPLEMDYRRHLNRHLVNVYYLDTATQQNK